MMNVLNWVKDNKVVTGLGVLVLGAIAVALTTKGDETEVVTEEVVDSEVVTEVIEPTQENV
jgi:hypothetical protein